ncbi:MAG TPA: lipopolysaccharide transport periplasmic protein LptA [Rhodocyclaceae bacterium]
MTLRLPFRPAPGLLIIALLLAHSAHAERADREKPINLEADRVTVDEAKKEHHFEGNVILTQGTLVIKSAKLVVTEDAAGNQKGTASGGVDGLARFRQKREGRDEYVDGEAERIEYDAHADKAEFYVRAHVKSGQDEVRGPFIAYDAKTETYLVNGGRQANGQPKGRVSAVIQPRTQDAAK